MALFGLVVSELLDLVVGQDQRWGSRSLRCPGVSLTPCLQTENKPEQEIQPASSESSAARCHPLESPQLSKFHCKLDPSTLNIDLWGLITVN